MLYSESLALSKSPGRRRGFLSVPSRASLRLRLFWVVRRGAAHAGQKGILPSLISGKMASPGTWWPHWMQVAVAKEP